MDLLPDDPRLFLPETDADAIPDADVLEALCSACIVNDHVGFSLLDRPYSDTPTPRAIYLEICV
jgi:hypothetical protein